MANTKDMLEAAWNRWQATGSYAKQQQKPYFFKHFCIYVAIMWNLADAQGWLLRHMYCAVNDWVPLEEVVNPTYNESIRFLAENFAKQVQFILEHNDVNLDESFIDFLFSEYKRVLDNAAKPASLRELAKRELPQPLIDMEALDKITGESRDEEWLEQ